MYIYACIYICTAYEFVPMEQQLFALSVVQRQKCIDIYICMYIHRSCYVFESKLYVLYIKSYEIHEMVAVDYIINFSCGAKKLLTNSQYSRSSPFAPCL